MKSNKILVQNMEVSIKKHHKADFISLTDIARAKNPKDPKDVVKNWLRSKTMIEFLGLWERINNSNFKGVEFDSFKNEAGSNSFTMSPKKWIDSTDAIGLMSSSGRYGGTFTHRDIAFEFASWVSAELIKQCLPQNERLVRLNETAISQTRSLLTSPTVKKIQPS